MAGLDVSIGADAAVFSRYTAHARALGSVNLAQGIPEARLDDSLARALVDSLALGWQYVEPRGLERLRAAIANEVYAAAFRAEDVLVTSGCTESLSIALGSLAGAWGERVAFLEPYYPYYPGFARLAGLEHVAVPLRAPPAELELAALERAFANGVRLLLLNTPHNPSGWVITARDARALRELLERYGVFLILDDAYRGFVYGAAESTGVDELTRDNERLFVAGSCSKLLSATGLRLGWLLGRGDALARAEALHMHLTYCQPAPLQAAAAALLEVRQAHAGPTLAAHYERKRDRLVDALRAVGMRCSAPQGGHFVVADYASLSAAADPETYALDFARRFGVMPLPLTPFCAPGRAGARLRFSFSVDAVTLGAAIRRMCSAAKGGA